MSNAAPMDSYITEYTTEENLVSYTEEQMREFAKEGLTDKEKQFLESVDEDSIDDSDLGPDFWENSFQIPPHSEPTEVFIAPEVFAWFEAQGDKRYMKINEALQTYIETQNKT